MRIHEEYVVFLMIDIQERLFPHINNNDELESNTIRLLKGINVLDLPLIVTEQYVKGLGETLSSLKNEINNFNSHHKMAFSCCDDEAIVEVISKTNRQTIILFGIEAHVCILQTALDLLEKNYHVVIVEDCISSRKENDKKIAIDRLKQEGVRFTSYESILFELCRESGTDRFKKLSKIIK